MHSLKSFKKMMIVMILVFTLSACSAKVEYMISFDSNGGTEVLQITTDGTTTITAPDNPTKEGYVFAGWYLDNDTFLNSFSAATLLDQGIISDLIVYAKWIEQEEDMLKNQLENIYLLAADSGFDGTYEEWLETVSGPQGIPGADGKEVLFQVAEGYIRWQYIGDTTWTNLIELETLNGADGTNGKSAYELYIETHPEYTNTEEVWLDDLINGLLGEKEEFTVSYITNNEETIDPTSLFSGDLVPIPEELEKIGYTFDGWFIDDVEWLFNIYTINNNLTLEASWKPIVLSTNSLNTYLNIGEIYQLPDTIEVQDYFGNIISVDCMWDTTSVYANSLGTDIIFGTLIDYDIVIQNKIHIYDASADHNVITGYVTGFDVGEIPIVTLSNQYVAYFIMVDENGYYEFLHIPDGTYTLKIELNGYNFNDPVTVEFGDISSSPSPLAVNSINYLTIGEPIEQRIMNVDFELEKFDIGHYSYEWIYNDSYFGFEKTANVVIPSTITFFDDELVQNNSSAAIKLYERYNVLLVDGEIPWNIEYASRALDMFERIPMLPNTTYNSTWTLTEDHIDNDITILDMGAYKNVTISIDAFKNATPKLAEIDYVKGVFYSDRLYHSIVRFITDNGEDLTEVNYIMTERFGLSIFVPSYSELTVDGEDSSHFEMFKSEELLSLLKMFEELPDGMHKTNGLDYLVRRKDGLVNLNYPDAPAIAWVSHGYIEFMGIAFSTTSENYLNRLIIHERSHFLWEYLFDDSIKDMWIELGGWYETTETASGWASTETTTFVSPYAHLKNPDEDMAESISYYLVQPEVLKANSIEKYEFIRDYIMHGTTYLVEIREDLTFEVYNLYPDYDYPGKINRVTIDLTGESLEDKILTVEIELNHEDGLFDGASVAYMRVYSEANTYFDLRLYPINSEGTILRGTTVISKFAKNGYWHTDQIIVTDNAGNQRFEGVSHYGWKLYVDNPLEDTIPPQYVPDSLSVEVVEDLIDDHTVYRVMVSYEVIEENIKSINGGYVSIDPELVEYNRFESWGYCDVDTHMCYIEFIFTDYNYNGNYLVNFISIHDLAGNIVNVNFPIIETGEQPVTFVLNTQLEDSTPPELDVNDISITAIPTNPEAPDGETLVTIIYYVKDDASGLGTVSYRLKDPQGTSFFEYHYHENFYNLFYEGDPTVWTQYTITVLLPRGSAPGVWGLQEIYLCDKAGNYIVYNFEEIIRFDIID